MNTTHYELIEILDDPGHPSSCEGRTVGAFTTEEAARQAASDMLRHRPYLWLSLALVENGVVEPIETSLG